MRSSEFLRRTRTGISKHHVHVCSPDGPQRDRDRKKKCFTGLVALSALRRTDMAYREGPQHPAEADRARARMYMSHVRS